MLMTTIQVALGGAIGAALRFPGRSWYVALCEPGVAGCGDGRECFGVLHYGDVCVVCHTVRHYPVEALCDDLPVRWVYDIFGLLSGGRQFV